jgi:hypothetical protein
MTLNRCGELIGRTAAGLTVAGASISALAAAALEILM